MQKAQILLLSLLGGFFCTQFTVQTRAQAPLRLQKLWYATPLDGNLEVSAPFGELRDKHFHSGVDYRIGAVIGAPVRAVLDGYVVRIVVRPDGFGKAVYINHPNGKTSVYAHLDAFAEPISQYVLDKQHQNKRFDLDLSFTPNQFPVSKLQVIGYGGNSGSSRGPHLHFEIRDQKKEHPKNFFAEGTFKSFDTISPVMTELVVYAIDTVMGMPISHFPELVVKKGRKVTRLPSKYKDKDTLMVPPLCYLGVVAADPVNGMPQQNPVYLFRLLLDGVNYFEWIRDQFDFSRSRYANAVADYVTAGKEGRVIQRFYKHKTWDVDFVKVCKMEGLISTKPNQVRKINIRLEDETGNRRDYTFFLKGSNQFKRDVLPKSIQKDTTWFALPMNKKKEIKRNKFTVSFPVNALYEGAVLRVRELPAKHIAVPTALEISALEIPGSFSGTPWHSSVCLSYPADMIPEAFRGKISWARAKASSNVDSSESAESIRTNLKNGNLECSIFGPGVFSLIIDTVPPTIVFKNVVPNDTIGTKKVIEIEIKDDFAGVDEYEVLWNNRWVLGEYDSKNQLLTISVKQELEGDQRAGILQISVKDKLGNRKSEKIALQL